MMLLKYYQPQNLSPLEHALLLKMKGKAQTSLYPKGGKGKHCPTTLRLSPRGRDRKRQHWADQRQQCSVWLYKPQPSLTAEEHHAQFIHGFLLKKKKALLKKVY